jgi:hypothetical protein
MAVDFQTVLASPDLTYAEGIRFFRGKGMLNNSLRRLADDFDRKGINYAAVDAVALNRHGYKRFTEDIDIRLTPEGLDRFRETLLGLGYHPSFDGPRKKFKITENNIPLDIVMAGEFPGDGLPKPVVFPDPADHVVVIDGVKTITLEKLIELKLASGMTSVSVKRPGRCAGNDKDKEA